MTQRSRKLVGTLLVLASIVAYSGLVMWAYMSFLGGADGWILIVFFALAGGLWFFPASWIIRWMARPD